MAEEAPFTNRLIHEKSPYLLQHAHNPIDWFPWGEEAFRKAKEEDKPIFLSIGYATCHWCHVMEEESFRDPAVAKVFNEVFVNIKVDREELPEVDSLYMEFAQGMVTGALGWPLNLILTPELNPLFAATYLPPKTRGGTMGLIDLATQIGEVWKSEEKGRLIEQADRIVEVFRSTTHYEKGPVPPKEAIDHSADIFFKMADPAWGGLKGAPKFPLAYQINFLIRYANLKRESRALFLVEKTLDKMARGGIFDHLGGGFSRYSVDEKWRVPHFEKMLYDNAILSEAYLEGYLAEKQEPLKDVAVKTLDYVITEMRGDEGGFYSAQDADSEGKEGLYYTWTPDEIRALFDPKDADLLCLYFDITPFGNFEGRSVLATPDTPEEFAHRYGVDPKAFKTLLREAVPLLLETRKKRKSPMKDDKILTSWNGMMLHALSEAGSSLRVQRFLKAAEKGAQFLLTSLWVEGELKHRYRSGEAAIRGTLDDYANLIRGLLSLFEATQEVTILRWALDLTEEVENRFRIKEGGYYQTDGLEPYLVLRKAHFADGAEPSGNSIHGENLLRLYQMTFDKKYLERVEALFGVITIPLTTVSPGYLFHMMNLLRYHDLNAATYILALDKEGHLKDEVSEAVFKGYHPHRAFLVLAEENELKRSLIPSLANYRPVQGETTLYICKQGVCQEPLVGRGKILSALSAS
jgi:uncharacterized protein YyaL (SSP411 family)